MLIGGEANMHELSSGALGDAKGERADVEASVRQKSLLAKMMRIEWLGQTVASICWIASVFTYGISSAALR